MMSIEVNSSLKNANSYTLICAQNKYMCVTMAVHSICIQKHCIGRISWHIKVKFNYNAARLCIHFRWFVCSALFFCSAIHSVWQIRFSLSTAIDSTHFWWLSHLQSNTFDNPNVSDSINNFDKRSLNAGLNKLSFDFCCWLIWKLTICI